MTEQPETESPSLLRRHAMAFALLLCSLGATTAGLGAGLLAVRTEQRRQCLRVVRLTARLLDERRANLSAEAQRLAQKFGRWEIRPAAAVQTALRSALRHRPDIDEISVYDENGMEVQTVSLTRPPGSKAKPGAMDQEDWRREKLTEDKIPLQTYRVVAGRAAAIEASAPILADGFEGYVVARISMKRLLSGLPESAGLVVQDHDCHLGPAGTGCPATRPAGRWTVSVACRTRPVWPLFLIGALLLLAGLWAAWKTRQRASQRRKPGKTDAEPSQSAAKAPGKVS